MNAVEATNFFNVLSLTIAGAALVFSIASPIVSSWIAGHYRLKEKKIEAELAMNKQNQQFYDVHRAHVIENYIKATGAMIASPESEHEAAYNSAMGEIYLYADKDLWPMIKKIHTNIENVRDDTAIDTFVKLCEALSSKEVRGKYKT